MTDTHSTTWQPAKPEKLAGLFTRLGWTGFWIQLALLAIPLLLLLYTTTLSSPTSPQRLGINLGNYMSYGSLAVLIFTTFWFLRYVRLGSRIADPERRPDRSSVQGSIWIGLWAGSLGVAFSLLLLLSAAGRMLFILLSNPQTGIMVAPAAGGDPVQSISAIDAVRLTVLVITLAAELVVLGFSIWLLFRATTASEAVAGGDN